MNELKVTLTKNKKAKPDMKNVQFGKVFTDHMFVMEYDAEKGWYDPRIEEFHNFSICPGSAVLHYGSEIFEGMKAYRTSNGEINLFRPSENFKRMNKSATRMTLPNIDEDFALETLKKLVDIDRDWVPKEEGTSLYIRPFMFANDESISVAPISKAEFAIIMSPVANYSKNGLSPQKILIEDSDVRAVRGGTGEVKCGGNYGGAHRAELKAEEKGYNQVLWLDGVERKYIEEVGCMNVMFKIAGKVVTPELTGSILPGITRKSVLHILKDKNIHCEETKISKDDLIKAVKNNTLEEAFGCGTAAVISPIGHLFLDGVDYEINNNKIGDVSQMLYDTIVGIQRGNIEDKYKWILKV
ncbi:MAG: branched-chain amino acid aminotransferase [Eubacteriales bacterium]|nr:branched-chain amino acid aminotransferase [Eubacteriales bacterium]